MLKTFIKNFRLLFFISLLCNSVSFAQEETTHYFIQKLINGTVEEKLDAAQEIEKNNIAHKEIEEILLSLLKESKIAKNDLIYISAYLSIIDTEEKAFIAYKLFSDNAIEQRANTIGETINKRRAYLFELANIKTVPESLITYLRTRSTDNNITSLRRKNLLTQLIINNPEIIPLFVSDIKNNPVTNMRILSQIGQLIIPYLPEINKNRNLESMAALKMFQESASLDEDILKFVLDKAIKPEASGFPLVYETHFSAALEVLAKHALNSSEAKNRLFALIKDDCFYYVMYAFSKYPLVLESLKPDLLELLFEILSDPKMTTSTSRIEKYIFISKQKIHNIEFEQLLVKNAIHSDNLMEKMNAIYALNSITNLSGGTIKFLEGLIDLKLSWNIRKLNRMLRSSKKYNAQIDKIKKARANGNSSGAVNFNLLSLGSGQIKNVVDLSSLYAAAILLKNNSQHENAKKILDQYYRANPELLSVDREHDYIRLSGSTNNYPVEFAAIGYFSSIYINISPIEALGYAYRDDSDELMILIEEGLKSSNMARSINAARMIINREIVPNQKIHNLLLDKTSSNVAGSSFNYFIRALKYVIPNNETFEILQNVANKNDKVRRKYALEVLENLKEK